MDIPYCGENSTETQKLHILLPDEGEGPYPVLISVHGGAWSTGNTNKNHEVSFTQEEGDRNYVLCTHSGGWRKADRRAAPGGNRRKVCPLCF